MYSAREVTSSLLDTLIDHLTYLLSNVMELCLFMLSCLCVCYLSHKNG